MAKPVKFNGQYYDIPKAVRCWQKYDHNTRANLASSHRVGFRQRDSLGEYYYIHPLAPDRAFDSPSAAYSYVLSKMAGTV